MNQQRPSAINCNQFRNVSDFVMSGPSPQTAFNSLNTQTRIPPPLPPRRPTQNYQSLYNDYRSLTPSYYGGGYGYGNNWNNRSLGSYGSYGGYPGSFGYNNQSYFGGPSGDVENRFVQMAEDSTRPAFQSIEAMVHTFSSVTMMLESTFFAMTSSFRAILSVAENVGRLRSMFGEVLNAFALIRFMKWLYWKSMYMLGLRGDDPNDEVVWQRTALDVINGERTGPSSWPILLFMSMLFTIPYLIHKLVKNAAEVKVNVNEPKEWFQHNEPIYTATALYDFNASSSDELSLRTGQKIWLAPQSLQPKGTTGWWRATDKVNVGLVPSTYVKVVGQLKKKSETIESQTTNTPAQNINLNINQKTESRDDCDFPDLEESYAAQNKDTEQTS